MFPPPPTLPRLRAAILAGALALVIAVPFALRPRSTAADAGAARVVIVTPMSEAIRHEFGQAFARWHRERYGRPAIVDWRALGGASEIRRYIASEFVNAARGWWKRGGRAWPPDAAEALLESAPDPARSPVSTALRAAFRAVDDPREFTCGMDLIFGGGEYDHTVLHQQGLTVEPWPAGAPPAGLFALPGGSPLIPEGDAGETWRTPWLFGCALSAFGICYNLDRLRDLGIANPPAQWRDLASPAYFRQIGVADPTQSGSVAKAFEMIVQQACDQALHAAGYSDDDIAHCEDAFAGAALPPGERPADVPPEYQRAMERGWLDGIQLLRRIGANARYFTDAGSKVPVDVSQGNAAAGIVIDFYARFQAQYDRDASGRRRMIYITPSGGSSVSADCISLLRGAERRETAARFIEFLLGEEGQRLWAFRPGTPGGPEKFALLRLPIRRDFYPSADFALQRLYEWRRPFTTEPLEDPSINPYLLARTFTYRPRWTARHFGILSDLVRAMCLDSIGELQAAWKAINDPGNTARRADALRWFDALPTKPEPFTWASSLTLGRRADRLDYLRAWTIEFRANYLQARAIARESLPHALLPTKKQPIPVQNRL